MARTVKPWQGRTDDAKIPPRVRQRVFDTHRGLCHLCKLPIKVGESWQADHVVALINGGANEETNLAPAHSHCHLAKTKADVAKKAKVARVRQKHTGAVRPKQSIRSAGFPSTGKTRTPKQSLAPRALFKETTGDTING